MDELSGAASALGSALGITKSTKAKLVCVGSNLPSGDHEIECMFNPTEYRLSQTLSVTRNRSTGTPGGTPQYSGTDHMTLTVQLFFDDFASAQGDVTPKITTLLSWTRPTDSSRDSGPCPPLVAFKWGGNPQLDSFSGFLTNINVNYTVFRRDGTPVQARVDVVIQGQDEQIGGQNPTSQAIDSRRVHTVLDGDTLQSIAFRELGKPAYWRAIAELNGIDDPLRLHPGQAILVPARADAAKAS